MKNIAGTHDCYGCGVCTIACSKHLIGMRLNKDGFYEPYIKDLDECTNCGLCVESCAFAHNECANLTAYPIESYGAWSNSKDVLRECSSGGVGFEIARTAIKKGYSVCGVKYNASKRRAEHYIATTLEDLELSKGSKYIQSYTPDGFRSINRKEKTLVFGTPCQIDSMRRYIRKFKVEDNFILVDFFCHSVPSLHAWNKYLDAVEKKTGKSQNVVWRDKETGWHDSWVMKIKGDKTENSSWWSKGDVFYRLFLGDFCSNKACQKDCKYKYNRSSADIRIGDAWGNEYKDNETGVSSLVVFTEKGQEMISLLKNCCTLEPQPFSVIAEGQMKKNVGETWITPIVRKFIRSNHSITLSDWNKLFFLESLPRRVVNKCKQLLRRGKQIGKGKIGIMTMHRVINSGSALQAFALQKKLEQLGYASEIIDYIFPNAAHVPTSKHQRLWMEHAPQWLQHWHKMRYLRAVPDDRKRLIRFTEFYKHYLKLSSRTYPSVKSLMNHTPKYDLYMTGSDQVWNPQHVKNDASFLFSFLMGG